jgi:hypothetical protein
MALSELILKGLPTLKFDVTGKRFLALMARLRRLALWQEIHVPAE